ncbi:hypothetical protein GY45DRAFT_455833 [Cubamyces sp. BRFM 1775]|nr:hypothetical protein GY45DRAFT_455833 [Cubamyces sp. BRFM 1775]
MSDCAPEHSSTLSLSLPVIRTSCRRSARTADVFAASPDLFLASCSAPPEQTRPSSTKSTGSPLISSHLRRSHSACPIYNSINACSIKYFQSQSYFYPPWLPNGARPLLSESKPPKSPTSITTKGSYKIIFDHRPTPGTSHAHPRSHRDEARWNA